MSIAVLGAGLLSQSASAGLIQSWHATSISGNQAPPPYGLRLDGFFSGIATQEVTFGFDSVLFDEFDDNTALLHGIISVVEVDGSFPGPVPTQFASSWSLDVRFLKVSTPSGLNPAYRYYAIDTAPALGPEMVNLADASDTVELVTYPLDLSMPFQVGFGANLKNANFGAAGWVNFQHGNIGALSTHYYSSDFLINLSPVPEPPTVTLLATCFLGLSGYGWRRKRKQAAAA